MKREKNEPGKQADFFLIVSMECWSISLLSIFCEKIQMCTYIDS